MNVYTNSHNKSLYLALQIRINNQEYHAKRDFIIKDNFAPRVTTLSYTTVRIKQTATSNKTHNILQCKNASNFMIK